MSSFVESGSRIERESLQQVLILILTQFLDRCGLVLMIDRQTDKL
jgi:hypothetical protein